jgi:hypothetical protein
MRVSATERRNAFGAHIAGVPYAAPAPLRCSMEGRGSVSRIERTYLPADTSRLAKKPEPPKSIRWNVYKIASKAV